MWISKKALRTLRRDNIAQNYNIEILEGIIKDQRCAAVYADILLQVYKKAKYQIITNFHNIRKHNSELKQELATAKEMRRRAEQTIKNIEDILYPGGKK